MRKPAMGAVKSGKWVYTFGDGKAEGKAGLRDLLGGKGANLAEMANLGLPVPPGFTIPTSVCTYFYAHDKSYPPALKPQVEKALDHVGKLTGKAFGDSKNPHEQLWGAIGAVFSSWMNTRAVTYRRLHDIPESWGTAVNVQAMVFGNMGETSATGVAFTRNPSTGESKLYGEFLINAQGEDVVAGIRTPQDITEEARKESGSDKPSMESPMPEAFKKLRRFYTLLEKHYRDMQDMEFTVEEGKLWMLQTRGGKRTAKAALRIAVELANDGLISKKDAVMRIDPASLDQLLHPRRLRPRHHERRLAHLQDRRRDHHRRIAGPGAGRADADDRTEIVR